MLAEDLSGMPLHQEIRETLRAMIARGLDPLEVAEAAQVVATSLSVGVEGEIRAGAKLYAAGAALMESANSRGTTQANR